MRSLINHSETVNELLARYGVKFGIYKNNTFHEQLFPFDAIPRIIEHDEFEYLEKGLIQRATALNCFLKDIYSEKAIVRDGVIPPEFVFSSSGYMAECDGVTPPKGIASHISGIDLVQAKDGTWYVLEDNLRVPSGASYPMIARELCRISSPETFRQTHIADNRGYAQLLKETIEPKQPIISKEENVHFINASESGIFVPRVEHWHDVKKGEHIGDIVDPLRGIVLERIESPCDGLVFTLREYPVVDEGSLIARILTI